MSHSIHLLINMDACIKNYHHQPVNQHNYQYQPMLIIDKNNTKIKFQTKKTSSCKAEINALQDDE